MVDYPSFSIIINTLNRGPELDRTLDSFRWLKYPGEFEVIVVNGPSVDNSEDIIASWKSRIRVGRCDIANLSVSRNIGICMAQGDIIAFIDDDAIPEPEWLAQLAEAYADPMVGAAGGFVYDHTGYELPYKYCLVDRFGNADLTPAEPMPHLSYPKSMRFPHLVGCNASFRRAALLELGGFDEEFEYFLDETDVCLRIVDAGYIIVQIDGAYVHHKCAPSDIRGDNRVVRDRFPILKNTIYFIGKHAREFYSPEHILKEQLNVVERERKGIQWCIEERLLDIEAVTAFESDAQRALERGVRRGLAGVDADALINSEKVKRYSDDFLPFSTISPKRYRVIVMISQDFPPNHAGGIGTFNKDLAESLAAEGHIIHVITKSSDINRVDFENGVWVHRLVVEKTERPGKVVEMAIPEHIWEWSITAFKEAERISRHRCIEVVEAPIWDCEGVAFLLNHRWPLLVSLQTTLHFWLDSHPEHKKDVEWMENFGSPMLALEKELMQQADAVRSISSAIQRDIEMAYDFTFDEEKVAIVPLGMPDVETRKVTGDVAAESLTILYVGRLEYRKGIDVFLNILPRLMGSVPELHVRIIGDDTLLDGAGKTYKEKFLVENSGADWLSNIQFEGRVDNDILRDAYAGCDIFVAPSRFESFGLIFLEAMREGKPVIGCLAGGMPEVVTQNLNGLLVEPSDADALLKATLCLVEDGELRLRMGRSGRQIFENKFTSEGMAQNSHCLYDIAEKNFQREK